MGYPLKSSSRKVLVASSIAPAESIRGIARYAREHDWHLVTDMVFTGSLPRGWSGDGVLALLPYEPELLSHIERTGLPCVTLGGAEHSASSSRVEADHAEIGRLAADHLLQLAHRSFVWAPFVNDAANRERLTAFQTRLSEHGRSCRMLPPAHMRIGPYWQENWVEHRRALVAELQRLPRPSAIFAFNDCVAADIVDACRDAGLAVPEDIAVLGVGNSLACETSPVPLSTINEGLDEIGYTAASVLDELMNGHETRTRVVQVPPKGIVTRVSTDVVAVTDSRVARALSYIAEHYPDPMLTVGAVADAVGMSRRNLERSFRDETGRTINEHIVNIRMREASRLLKTHPRAKSTEIASLIGITEAGTFFRTFRRYFGMSPKAHRVWAAQTCDSAHPFNPAHHSRLTGPQPATGTSRGLRSTAA